MFFALFLFVGLALGQGNGQNRVVLTVDVPFETCYAVGDALRFNISVFNNGNAGKSNDGSTQATYVWLSNPAIVPSPQCPTTQTVAAQATALCHNLIAFPATTQLDVTVGVSTVRPNSNGNGQQTDSQIVTVAYFGLPTVTATAVNATCVGGTGNISFTINAATGSGPYTYTVDGVAGGQVDANIAVSVVSASVGTHVIAVQALDLSSCQATTSVTVGQPPSGVTFTHVATSPTCNNGANGQIVVTASGGGVASYQYSSNNGASWTVLKGASHTFIGLVSGNYSVIVRNSALCAAPVQVVEVRNPLPILLGTIGKNITCNGGSDGAITASINGGDGLAPYTYTLSGAASATQSSPVFANLAIGTYTVTVVDSHSPACSVTSLPVTITQPSVVVFSATAVSPTCNNVTQLPNQDGIINVVASGGSGSYVYSLNNGVSFSAATGGTYSFTGLQHGAVVNVTVRDSAGCVPTTGALTFTIETPVCLTMCSRSQGYWKNHRAWTTACTIATPTCALWCGNSFSYYLDTSPRGNAVIAAGKQFVAFVLDFFYYNEFVDIRAWTVSQFPVGFPTVLAEAFVALRDGCTLPRSQLLANAAILEQFNSHNSTLYPWLSECSGGYTVGQAKRNEPAASLIKQLKK